MTETGLMIRDWLPIALAAGGTALAAMLWRMRGEFCSKGEARELERRLGSMESALVGISARIENMPDHSDLIEIREHLAGMRSEIQGTRDVMERLEYQVKLVLEHQLRGGH